MRSRINAVLMLAASCIVFIAVGSAKSVQTSGHQSPALVLTDGGGPMCIPDSGCGVVGKTDVQPILQAAGPGPMCIPDAGCGYREGVTANESSNPDPQLADGTGPMCFPDIGCGHRLSVQTGAGKEYFPAAVLLADGTGPMCFPDVGCGYRNDKANMLWPS
jgi:hypothetical protein